MWAYQAREIDSPIPCPYAKEFRAIAQETVFSRVTETTPPEMFTKAQQLLLSLYQDLTERMQQKDLFHFPSARTGRHWCVLAEYEHAYHRLRNFARMYDPPPPPPEPAPKPQPLTDAELMERLKEYVKRRTKETFFGQNQEEEESA
jgi:hypothetical protein